MVYDCPWRWMRRGDVQYERDDCTDREYWTIIWVRRCSTGQHGTNLPYDVHYHTSPSILQNSPVPSPTTYHCTDSDQKRSEALIVGALPEHANAVSAKQGSALLIPSP